MQFFTFPLLALPLALWAISAAVLVYFVAKMISDVVHDEGISRVSRVIWCLLMVPFLPLAALAYLIVRHDHHSTMHHA